LYALDLVDWYNYSGFRILSLGCGATPDLMVFEQANRKLNKNISYYGIDINPLWESIHGEIREYAD
jgi:hypothetical protein